jgi:hypothetical protein
MVRSTAGWVAVVVAFVAGCIGGRTEMESANAPGAVAAHDAGTSRFLDGRAGSTVDAAQRADGVVPIDARLSQDLRVPTDTRVVVDLPVPDARIAVDTRNAVDQRPPVDLRLPIDGRLSDVCAEGNVCRAACTVSCNGIGTRTCDCLGGRLSCGVCEVQPIVVSQSPCPTGANGRPCPAPGTVSAGGQGTGCICINRARTGSNVWLCL